MHMKTIGNPSQPIYPSTYGPAFDREKDLVRLTGQLQVIAKEMEDAAAIDMWLTLKEIEYRTGYTSASISAQLRHLRKPQFGSHTVDKRRRVDAEGTTFGTWEYKVTK
jgi:hypothetical protein